MTDQGLRRRPTRSQWLGLWCVVTLAASQGWAFPVAETEGSVVDLAPTLGIDGLVRGQRGYGLSVFEGRQLDRFEFEVLGVVRNSPPGQDYVMARLSGQGLEHSGIIAGMSGSPVYIEDKLIGAVAFSWAFAKDPIAMITPIASMRAIGERGQGSSGGQSPSGSAARSVEELLDHSNSEERLAAAFQQLRPQSSSQASPAIGWGLAGFPGSVETRLAQSLGSVGPIGEAMTHSLRSELLPGSSVAAVLVDGDLRMAATGTVTDRIGDEVLAFGHPFYSLGAISLPMAEAEIITVMPSQANSFKISSLGKIVGAFHEDRQAGIRGRVGAVALTTPLNVTIHTTDTHRFSMELARIPQLTAALAAVATLGAQGTASTTTGPMGLDLDLRFDLGDHGQVALEQSFDGLTAATDAALFVMSYVNFFLQNSFDEVIVESIDIVLVQHQEPRTAIMVSGYADRTKVRPGDTVGLNLEFVPYRGDIVRHRVSVNVPADVPAGRYSLLVGDGVTIDLQRQTVEPASPIRLDQALRIIDGFHSRRDLVVLGLHSGRGLAVAGEVLPQLPGSMQSLWTTASSRSAVPLRLVVAQEFSERLEVPIAGGVRIDLEVERANPMTSGAKDQAEQSGVQTETESKTQSSEGRVAGVVSRGKPLGGG